ncbi:STAS domain-containing protein [Desulfosarcina sp. OttesenSCG-928-B08]|nr:STAS domain-containing protein [Desulfosarcina sp. OttesenSCG-928-B08]
MHIETTKTGRADILSLNGKLDAVTAPEYEQRVTALLTDTPCFLVIDFTHLEYISSAGLRALLVTAKRIQGKGGQLHFSGVTGEVLKVFEISGFLNIFKIWASVNEALNAIG